MDKRMKLLDEIIEYNQQFIEEKKYEEFTTTKFPQKKKAVILSCMDTRLVELLPRAMNMKKMVILRLSKVLGRLFLIHLEVLCEAF
ncbi:hypothetical protein BsIDN1_53760 [Bacillus safensis]|uniref:Carbonic anhydrase n=1 Tax=Bacillus safensis TaxID=561879 RepID=A0A5S9MFE5_BACIA|nr:hypothetical protein BsIDN1_53760 [Bacillus safensis]